jgi:hypothetical protein
LLQDSPFRQIKRVNPQESSVVLAQQSFITEPAVDRSDPKRRTHSGHLYFMPLKHFAPNETPSYASTLITGFHSILSPAAQNIC